MFDVEKLTKMFADWWQIVKANVPEEENTDKFYDTIYDECVKFSEKYRDADEADRWLVVAMVDVYLNYEARRLEGLKPRDDTNLKEYLRKMLNS